MISIAELQGGYFPDPIPPGFRPPPPAQAAVPVIEPTEGDWTAAGSMGRSVNGPLPLLEGGVITIFNRDRLYGPPKQRLLHLYRSNNIRPAIGGQNADVYAHVTYGVGGAQNEFFCDWFGHVPLVCDSVRVDAVSYAPLAVGVLPYQASQNLTTTFGAMLGNVGASPAQAPTLTTSQQSLANGGASLTYFVPDFAKKVKLNTNLAAVLTTDFTIVFGSSTFDLSRNAASSDLLTTGICVPGWAQQISVVNNSAAPATSLVGLTYVLGL